MAVSLELRTFCSYDTDDTSSLEATIKKATKEEEKTLDNLSPKKSEKELLPLENVLNQETTLSTQYPNILNSSPLTTEVDKIQHFLSKHPDTQSGLTIKLSLSTIAGTLGGGAAGGGIGFVAGGGLLGVLGGSLIGGVAGGLITNFCAKKVFFKQIRNDDIYKDYFDILEETYSQITQEIEEQYQTLIETDNQFKKFICPLTRGFIVAPVKHSGQKTIYEKFAIETHIIFKPSGNNSPTREGHMELKNLHYDFSYLPKLIQTIDKVKSTAQIALELHKYLQQKINLCKKSRETVISSMLGEVQILHLKQEITDKVCSTATDFLKEEYLKIKS